MRQGIHFVPNNSMAERSHLLLKDRQLSSPLIASSSDSSPKLPPLLEQGVVFFCVHFWQFLLSFLESAGNETKDPNTGRSQKDVSHRGKETPCSTYIFLGDLAAGRP